MASTHTDWGVTSTRTDWGGGAGLRDLVLYETASYFYLVGHEKVLRARVHSCARAYTGHNIYRPWLYSSELYRPQLHRP